MQAYHLSGDTLQKAIELSRLRVILHFVSAFWGIAAALGILYSRFATRLRNISRRLSRNLWVQGMVFLPLLLLVVVVLDLPADVYRQHVERYFHMSVQGWGSWLWDQTKGFLILTLLAYLPAVTLIFLLRRFPRTWWLWFWTGSVPFTVLMVFVSPVLIEPMMETFEPLTRSDPALVARLEQIVHRGGLTIEPARMFLMKASAKTAELNAYVTGIGASERVVVWDTSIQRATPDEISFIFGHEMGHYVLHHIWLGLGFACLLSFIGLWVTFFSVNWLFGHYGPRWRIASLHDWAMLGVFLLLLNVLGFVSEPVSNSFSRMLEHSADVYGQEVIHGIVGNPRETAREAFQVLGETSLVDPNPNAFVEFWTGSHPSIAERAKFAEAYDPWKPGARPRYFSK